MICQRKNHRDFEQAEKKYESFHPSTHFHFIPWWQGVSVKSVFWVKGFAKNDLDPQQTKRAVCKNENCQKFDFDKINFTFNIQEKNFTFSDVKLDLNKKSISIPKLKAIKKKDDFLISGKIINKDTTLRKKELDPFIDSDFIVSNVQEINVDSENDFSFILSKKFKIRNLNIDSKINLKKMKLNNFFELENFFPKIKKFILLWKVCRFRIN